MTSTMITWHTGKQRQLELPLVSCPGQPHALAIPICADAASMLAVEAVLTSADRSSGYRASFVIEWVGEHRLQIPRSLFKPFGNPGEIGMPQQLTLTAGDAGFAGTVLTVGTPQWLEQAALVPANAGESFFENFTHPGFWDIAEWTPTHTGGTFKPAYLYAELSVVPGAESPQPVVARSKRYALPIDGIQALLAAVAVDDLGAFSLILRIDGKEWRAVDRQQGCGDYEELRVPVRGRLLEQVTVELTSCAAWQAGEAERKINACLFWLIAEAEGADPAMSHEVYGCDDIAAPDVCDLRTDAAASASAAGEPLLPVGFLFGPDSLRALREQVRQGIKGRMFAEMIAEVEDNLGYRPEDYVGTYMPVDWGKQGIERASSPNGETRRMYSTLVYTSFAYAVTGDKRFGLAARRALLATARIKHWAAGPVARIPVGLRGYRHPFIESHTSQAVALCYDFIYGLLSEAERQEVEDALFEKGVVWIDAFLRQNSEHLLKLKSNTGVVFALGLLYAALAAKRTHPQAEEIFERWSGWLLQRMMPAYYMQDGSTSEGFVYWEYTTHYAIEALLVIAGHRGCEPQDLVHAAFGQTMQYMLHMRSLSHEGLRFLPISDSRNEDFRFMGPPLLFFARYFDIDGGLRLWHDLYAGAHEPGSPFFGEPKNTGQFTTNGLLALLLAQEREAPPSSLEQTRRFTESDRILWRSGTGVGDWLVFFEGGAQTFNHTHFDKGQFLLEAYGESLVSEPGMIAYSNPFHTALLDSQYHNVITAAGRNQTYEDAARAVVIRSLVSGDGYELLQADLSGSYKELRTYNRTLLFVRTRYVLLLDEVESDVSELQWHLHSKGAYREASRVLPGAWNAREDAGEAAGEDAGGDGGETAGEAADCRSDAAVHRYEARAAKAGLHAAIVADQPLMAKIGTYMDGETLLSHHLALAADASSGRFTLAALLVPDRGLRQAGTVADIVVTAVRTANGASFTVSGSFGFDRVDCDFAEGSIRVFRDDGAMIESNVTGEQGVSPER